MTIDKSSSVDIDVKSPQTPIARLILAHGAGAGKEHPFMQEMASHLVAGGIEVVLFNFPYMQQMKETGKRRPPDKADKLLAHFAEVITHTTKNIHSSLPTFVGGKSMGGRMASMLYQEHDEIQGAMVFGYPFHPPGKPEKTRIAHMPTLTKPMLIIQGERDTFGTEQEVLNYTLPASIDCVFLADGDHSFKPRKASGKTQHEHMVYAAKLCVDFISRLI